MIIDNCELRMKGKRNEGKNKMSTIMISINTMKDVSTIQFKYDDEYIVENSKWTDGKAKFPYMALLRGVYRIVKLRLKKRFPSIVNKLKNKLIN